MANLATIRQALANVISAAVPTVNVSAYYIPQITPPAIIVDVQPLAEVWATFDGAVDYNLRLSLLASAADDPSGQMQLDNWLASSGAGSVVAAINANPRLLQQGQPVCDYCVINRIGVPGAGQGGHGGYGYVDWAGIPYIGTNIFVEVAASLP